VDAGTEGHDHGGMAHSPHRRWKGCRLCKPHKDKRLGDGERAPYAVARRAGGRRRYSRRAVGDED
jgi:hypothetical protein